MEKDFGQNPETKASETDAEEAGETTGEAVGEAGLPQRLKDLLQRFTKMPYSAILAIAVVLAIGAAYFLTLPAAKPPAPAVFKLTVLSEYGEPIEGAAVEVYEEENFLTAVTTNENGVAVFEEELPKTLLVFKVSKRPDFMDAETSVDTAVEEKATVVLEAVVTPVPGVTPSPKPRVTPSPTPSPTPEAIPTPVPPPTKGRVLVFVRGTKGEPLNATTRVTAYYASTNALAAEVSTNKYSDAVIEGLDAGSRIYLTAYAEGYLPYDGKAENLTVREGVTNKTIRLRSLNESLTATTSIAFTDEQNHSIRNAVWWKLYSSDYTVLLPENRTTAGSVSLRLEVGPQYFVSARSPMRLPNATPLFKAGENQRLVLPLIEVNKSANLSVTVVDEDNNTLAGASVVVALDLFTSYSKNTSEQGTAVFTPPNEPLPRWTTVVVRASKGVRSGEANATLSEAENNVTITLEAEKAFAQVEARDALTNASIPNALFEVFYRNASISTCTTTAAAGNCTLTIRAGGVNEVLASAGDYYGLKTPVGGVGAGETVNLSFPLVPTNVSENAFIQFLGFRDERANLVSELEAGRRYYASFHVVTQKGDFGGVYVRIAANASGDEGWITGHYPAVASYNGSTAYRPGCVGAKANENYSDAGYKWLQLNFPTQEGQNQVFAFEVLVNKDTKAKQMPLFYRAWITRGASWLRNPFDEKLGVDANTIAKKGCDALAYNASASIIPSETTCSDFACITLEFQQGSRSGGSGFAVEDFVNCSEEGKVCEPFYIYYRISLLKSLASGRLAFTSQQDPQQDYLVVDSVTWPRLTELGALDTAETLVNSSSFDYNVSEAIVAAKASRERVFEGTITARAFKPSAKATLILSFAGDNNSVTHATWITVTHFYVAPKPTILSGFDCGSKIQVAFNRSLGLQASCKILPMMVDSVFPADAVPIETISDSGCVLLKIENASNATPYSTAASGAGGAGTASVSNCFQIEVKRTQTNASTCRGEYLLKYNAQRAGCPLRVVGNEVPGASALLVFGNPGDPSDVRSVNVTVSSFYYRSLDVGPVYEGETTIPVLAERLVTYTVNVTDNSTGETRTEERTRIEYYTDFVSMTPPDVWIAANNLQLAERKIALNAVMGRITSKLELSFRGPGLEAFAFNKGRGNLRVYEMPGFEDAGDAVNNRMIGMASYSSLKNRFFEEAERVAAATAFRRSGEQILVCEDCSQANNSECRPNIGGLDCRPSYANWIKTVDNCTSYRAPCVFCNDSACSYDSSLRGCKTTSNKSVSVFDCDSRCDVSESNDEGVGVSGVGSFACNTIFKCTHPYTVSVCQTMAGFNSETNEILCDCNLFAQATGQTPPASSCSGVPCLNWCGEPNCDRECDETGFKTVQACAPTHEWLNKTPLQEMRVGLPFEPGVAGRPLAYFSDRPFAYYRAFQVKKGDDLWFLDVGNFSEDEWKALVRGEGGGIIVVKAESRDGVDWSRAAVPLELSGMKYYLTGDCKKDVAMTLLNYLYYDYSTDYGSCLNSIYSLAGPNTKRRFKGPRLKEAAGEDACSSGVLNAGKEVVGQDPGVYAISLNGYVFRFVEVAWEAGFPKDDASIKDSCVSLSPSALGSSLQAFYVGKAKRVQSRVVFGGKGGEDKTCYVYVDLWDPVGYEDTNQKCNCPTEKEEA